MTNLIKEINTVYMMISSIPVINDAIDISAAVRAKLRRIESALIEMDKEATREPTEE